MAYTCSPKGPLFARMGQVMSAKDDPLGNDETRGQRLWLLPEEVLYLIERGTLDVRWPAVNGEEEGLSMSLQGAYAMLLGDEESHEGALTFERYSVYAGLKRMGYTVLRAPTWNSEGPPLDSECFAPLIRRPWDVGLSNFTSWWRTTLTSAASKEAAQQASGPLIHPQLFRSYADIYRRLALISYYDPTTQHQPPESNVTNTDPSFRITYHVWKPGSQTFKKSAPGPPDFRIAVINARETTVPTLQQLSALLDTTPYDPPHETAQLYQKLKHGYKNVVLAVVDQGVTSYLRIADAAFGREKLYERNGKGLDGKRGGRGGRGRGR